MNFFGVGGAELIAIFVIMLVFAGPKRMIHWSYVLGQYVAKFRVIWSQTVDLVQKEFDEAGVDIKLPKEPPTRQNLNRSLGEAIKPMTKPIQDSLAEVKKDVDTFQDLSDSLNNKNAKKAVSATSKLPAAAAAAKSQREPSAKSDSPQASTEKSPTVNSPPAEKSSAVNSPNESSAPDKTTEQQPADLGTWSGAAEPSQAKANGKPVDLGAWSATALEE